jgi:hypothetical protein
VLAAYRCIPFGIAPIAATTAANQSWPFLLWLVSVRAWSTARPGFKPSLIPPGLLPLFLAWDVVLQTTLRLTLSLRSRI